MNAEQKKMYFTETALVINREGFHAETILGGTLGVACELANLTIFGYSYRMYSVRFYLCEGAIWAE